MNTFKRIALRTSFVALLAAVMGTFLPRNASAQDIAGSFSIASNPNGPWSYGTYVESTSTFTPFTVSSPSLASGYWTTASGFPVVVGNNTGATVFYVTWALPTDTLNLHPADAAGTDSDVRWTAPAAGTYTISGSFSALDSTTTLDSILVGGTSAFSTNINFSSNPSAGFSLTDLTLSLGETIDFTVNCCSGSDQSYDNDSTGLQGSIEPSSAVTPEPASFFLMGSGLLAMAGILRRRVFFIARSPAR